MNTIIQTEEQTKEEEKGKARKEMGRQGRKWEGKERKGKEGKERKERREITNQQASKQTVKQASKQASKQTNQTKQTNNGAMERWVDGWIDGSINPVSQYTHVHNHSCTYEVKNGWYFGHLHVEQKMCAFSTWNAVEWHAIVEARSSGLVNSNIVGHGLVGRLSVDIFMHSCCTFFCYNLAVCMGFCKWPAVSLTISKSRRGKKHKAGKGYLSCTTSRLQATLQALFATKWPIGREPLTFTRSLSFWKETHHGLRGDSIWGFGSCPWNIQLGGERVRSSGGRHNVQSRVWDLDDLDSQNLFKPISAVTNLGNLWSIYTGQARLPMLGRKSNRGSHRSPERCGLSLEGIKPDC